MRDHHGTGCNSVLEDGKGELSGWLGDCLKDVSLRHIDLWTQCCSNKKLNFFGEAWQADYVEMQRANNHPRALEERVER